MNGNWWRWMLVAIVAVAAGCSIKLHGEATMMERWDKPTPVAAPTPVVHTNKVTETKTREEVIEQTPAPAPVPPAAPAPAAPEAPKKSSMEFAPEPVIKPAAPTYFLYQHIPHDKLSKNQQCFEKVTWGLYAMNQ